MIRWLLALFVWIAALLLISWYLLPDRMNGAYIVTVLVMVAVVIPIVQGIVRALEERN